jgi:hypothetical protein
VFALSLVTYGKAVQVDQTSARRLYAVKKCSKAPQYFLPLAEGGNPVAQLFEAVIFDNGQAVPAAFICRDSPPPALLSSEGERIRDYSRKGCFSSS